MRAPRFWWGKPGAAAVLLSPLAAIYGGVTARRLKQSGARAGIPVICVGNLTVGGAGKTPTAMAIARMLIDAGERPYFLTRGYGGRLAGPVVVEAGHTAVQVGDEPLLLSLVAPAIVAANRTAGAQLARQKGASIIVMDDGFQNPSLAKDLSILVIDGGRGIGNGYVLPAGPLRAPLAPQLDRADAILIVGNVMSGAPLATAARTRKLPLFHATLEPDTAAVAALAGRKVLAFAGIGDPDKFFATVAAARIDAPVRRGFADHHRYGAKEARALIDDAARNKLSLLTTEKDAARIQSDATLSELAGRMRVLPVRLNIEEGADFRKLVLGACKRA
ncbi:MAG: tetraacyldisaccharide 4'-kinase [Alphaproteobacteria bacterium]